MAHVKSSTAHPFQCEGGGQPEEKAVGEQDRHAEAQQLVLEAEVQLEEPPYREDLPVDLWDRGVPSLEGHDP